MKIRAFKNETFDFYVALLWPCTPVQFKEYVREAGFSCKDVAPCAARCYSERGNHIIGFRRWSGDAVSLGTLAHELIHVTCYAMKECDIALSDETEECFAYLHGSLFERCAGLMK